MFTLRVLITLIVLSICTVSDIRTREINVLVLLAGIIILICFGEGLRLAGVVPGIIFLLVSKLRIGIGEGDAYILIFLGLISGLNTTFNTVAVSFMVAAVYALILKLYRRAEENYSFPFAPFILLGFTISIIISKGVMI